MKGLKVIRESRGYTQVALAKQLDVAQSSIATWETGAGYPQGAMLEKLADILDCTIDALFGREPSVPPPAEAAS